MPPDPKSHTEVARRYFLGLGAAGAAAWSASPREVALGRILADPPGELPVTLAYRWIDSATGQPCPLPGTGANAIQQAALLGEV
ncbi:MAG: hypothetical protein Q8N47_27800 [Bryobacterales bacterium]|nr:hypothetical protein [Bryobacterales bacterium]